MLAKLLKDESGIALTMYLRLKSDAAREAATQAVAEEVLDGKLLAEYSKLMKRISKVSRQRNNVVHGYWASIDQRDDIVILYDTRGIVPFALTGIKFINGINIVAPIAQKYSIEFLNEYKNRILSDLEKAKKIPDSERAIQEITEDHVYQDLKTIYDNASSMTTKHGKKLMQYIDTLQTYTEKDFIDIEDRIIALHQEIEDFGEKAISKK